MDLSNLKPAEGSKHSKKRIGRGHGSGQGAQAGRGHKGAKSRSGFKFKRGFEGGQMPLHRRLPKRGFRNTKFQLRFNEVNLGKVQAAIDAKLLDTGALVDAAALVKAGLMRRAKDGVRLLGGGELKSKVDFAVYGASKSAQAAVEKGSMVEALRKARARLKDRTD